MLSFITLIMLFSCSKTYFTASRGLVLGAKDATWEWRDVYVGYLMGVHARVALNRESNEASVILTGAPLCGRLEGTATLAVDGSVVLDSALAKALRLRMCSIERVYENKVANTVTAIVKLPFLGSRRIVMTRRQ
jgi:hypothetical protein